jgi:hypothetical protein
LRFSQYGEKKRLSMVALSTLSFSQNGEKATFHGRTFNLEFFPEREKK